MILKYKVGSQDTPMASGWSACIVASASCSRDTPPSMQADQSLAHSKPSSVAGFLPIGNHFNDFYAQTVFPETKNQH